MSTRINDFQMQDFTVAINKIPRGWNLLDSLGIADTVGISTETASVDVVTEKTNTFGDTRRGGARNFVSSETVRTESLVVPFFSLDGQVRPTDLQNLRRWGTENELQSTDEAVERIMTRIRRYHGALREKAIMEAIKGSAYAPNGTTTAYNYYTVFNETKKQVAFDLTNTAVNPIAKAEEAWGHIIDNADDGASSYDVIALCSPEFFDKLIDNDFVKDAYTYYSSTQEPRRNRQGEGRIYREFVHGNIRYIDYRGAFEGSRLVPVDKAYIMPVGIQDMFKVYHSPADHLDYVNTEGQENYMFVFRDPKGRKIEVESETGLLCVSQRPGLVVECTSAASF